ncbi:hypothetical protein I4U23_013123 [Adineta vaga]|nr:hypothetical protein I4U23_013123 [Adineta vaga]
MSFQAPCDRPNASPLDRRGTGAYNINAGIDSSIISDPAHRGTLSTPELEAIHKSEGYKQAMKHQDEDDIELSAKMKYMYQAQKHDEQREKRDR